MSTSEIITIVANLALTLSFIVALVFGIAQVKAVERDRKERLTLEAMRNFQSREFAELIGYVSSHKMPKTLEELRDLPDNERAILIQFGQQMEMLGMLVAERIVDIELVDKTLGSFVSTSWERGKKFYMDVRQKTNDPFLSEYFQWLAELIDKRMKGNPRKPFHERMDN
jgi:hypothetical protein